jgi:hypothetical protein
MYLNNIKLPDKSSYCEVIHIITRYPRNLFVTRIL